MKQLILTAIFVLVSLFACQKEEIPRAKTLIGEWDIVQVDIYHSTRGGHPSEFFFDIGYRDTGQMIFYSDSTGYLSDKLSEKFLLSDPQFIWSYRDYQYGSDQDLSKYELGFSAWTISNAILIMPHSDTAHFYITNYERSVTGATYYNYFRMIRKK